MFTLSVTIINIPFLLIDKSLTPLWIAVCADFCFITFFWLYLWGLLFEELDYGTPWYMIIIHLPCALVIQPFASVAEGLSAIWGSSSSLAPHPDRRMLTLCALSHVLAGHRTLRGHCQEVMAPPKTAHRACPDPSTGGASAQDSPRPPPFPISIRTIFPIPPSTLPSPPPATLVRLALSASPLLEPFIPPVEASRARESARARRTSISECEEAHLILLFHSARVVCGVWPATGTSTTWRRPHSGPEARGGQTRRRAARPTPVRDPRGPAPLPT